MRTHQGPARTDVGFTLNSATKKPKICKRNYKADTRDSEGRKVRSKAFGFLGYT